MLRKSSINGTKFYFIVDDNGIIYDYGKITKFESNLIDSQLLPYGGSKAYNVYGYDENGYDNKGYKTDGYNDAGYDRDGYDKSGFNSDGYDRDGYDKSGYNANGYDRGGYKKDGYNDAGYDKDGYDRDGYDKNGYDRKGYDKDGYDRAGYDKNGYDRNGYDKDGYGRDGYNKNGYDVKGYNRDGYNKNGFNKQNVCKDGYVYTQGYKHYVRGIDYLYRLNKKPKYITGLTKWCLNGRSAMENGTFNFNVADLNKIQKSYSGCDNLIRSLRYVKGETQNGSRIRSGVGYITVPKSYIKKKAVIVIEHTNNVLYRTHFTVKKTSYKFKMRDDDIVNCYFVTSWNLKKGMKYKGVKFAYKYVPSTSKVKKTTSSVYKGKIIASDKTKVTLSKGKSTTTAVYLANIDVKDISVKADTSIVKVTKTNKLNNTYIQLKLTGTGNKGTTTVTIKDKNGHSEKIKVTNK